MTFVQALPLLALILPLAACGGGGSDGPDPLTLPGTGRSYAALGSDITGINGRVDGADTATTATASASGTVDMSGVVELYQDSNDRYRGDAVARLSFDEGSYDALVGNLVRQNGDAVGGTLTGTGTVESSASGDWVMAGPLSGTLTRPGDADLVVSGAEMLAYLFVEPDGTLLASHGRLANGWTVHTRLAETP